MRILDTRVAPEWVDYNGHMNDAEYARVFSLAVESLMDHIGLDATGRECHGYTLYTLETHLCYRREAHTDQPLGVDACLLDRDTKRLHVFFELVDDEGHRLATSEQMLMGMGIDSGRPGAFPEPVATGIDTLPHIEADAWPEVAGRRIGMRRSDR